MSAFDRALVGIDRILGWGSARSFVQRVELHREGGLVLTLNAPDRPRWFLAHGDDLCPMLPEEDRRLPLCEARAEELRSGAVEILSWRPGRRIVLRPVGEPSRVLKGYRRGRSAAAVARHRLAWRALARDASARTVPMLEHEEGTESMALAFTHGHPVRVQAADADIFHKLGAATSQLRAGLAGIPLDEHGPAAELAVLDDLERTVASVRGPVDGWAPLRRELEAALQRLAPRASVASHRDLHDGQVLTVEDDVVLLDFDLLCAADPALDPANLTAHLALRALQGAHGATRRGAENGARAFLEGLRCDVDEEFLRRLRTYQAATFLRLALLYSLRPRWRELSVPLVELAARVLPWPGVAPCSCSRCSSPRRSRSAARPGPRTSSRCGSGTG